MKKITGLFIFGIFLLFSACYYDKSEVLYPSSNQTSCDTTNVTYSGTIQGILSTNCISCHKPGGSASSYGNLDNYPNVKAYLDADKTNFINAISYTGTAKMPPSSKLSDCEISQLKKWINAGYPNN